MRQLKTGAKRTINWNEYQSKVKIQAQNQHLNYLIGLSLQGINRLFVLSFENNDDRKGHSEYFFPKVEIKDCNVMIDGKNIFDQPLKIILEHMIIFKNLRLVKRIITQLVVY